MLKIHFPALVLQIKIYLIIPLLRYCPQPNPYRVHPVSRNARCAASCGVSPKTLHFFILLPSALPTIPSNCILPSGNLQAYAPIGIWQSPPVPFKNSRSAHVISSVTISESAFTCSNEELPCVLREPESALSHLHGILPKSMHADHFRLRMSGAEASS